jgi:hypothetical protein
MGNSIIRYFESSYVSLVGGFWRCGNKCVLMRQGLAGYIDWVVSSTIGQIDIGEIAFSRYGKNDLGWLTKGRDGQNPDNQDG